MDTESIEGGVGIFSSQTPTVDRYHRVTTGMFLELLIHKIEKRITESEILLSNLEYCLKNRGEEKCSEIEQWFNKEAPYNAIRLRKLLF